MGRKTAARLLPVFGFLFLTAYIRSAALNVVYTDYIRLVNSYLADVLSPAPYLHGDILTRIPANYPERILNVLLFHYSTSFDMMLGALGLALSAFVLGAYCLKRGISAPLTGGLVLLLFSLNKWEMLLNGSGWVHFAAFALFWYHYLVYDRYLAGEGRRGDGLRLLVLPWLTILCFAGPYCGVYAVTLLLADGFMLCFMRTDRRAALCRMLCTLLPLLLYLMSRALSVEERAGATTEPIQLVLRTHPLLLPRFFLRSFASPVLGLETAEDMALAGLPMTLLGALVFAGYVRAFWLNFRGRLYRRTSFPLLLLTAGFLNHVLVTAARWIFLNESYGMSSRYALQYQIGIVGVLLSFALSLQAAEEEAGDAGGGPGDAARCNSALRRGRRLLLLGCALVFFGNILTTAREIRVAPYRQEYFYRMREVALDFENRSDEELKQVLQYHDPQRIRKALTLLKERRLNIYYE